MPDDTVIDMVDRIRVSRIAGIPDPLRLERCLRLPELGPRVLFFSGGTALRSISRRLKHYTHNSIHLITPFDSGGSSAKLRDAFDMLAVGDLRNRLMALADESVKGNPSVYELFSYRLSETDGPEKLRAELWAMVFGDHRLIANVEEPMRRLIRTHLRHFIERMPKGFDLRLASIGNLILTGGYLANEGDIQSVIFLFSKLVEVRGSVRPVIEGHYHLVAELADGHRVVGQHLITRPDHNRSRIEKLYLSSSKDGSELANTQISEQVRRLFESADLICYPIGSFYTSVIANLLPGGVGQAIADAPCPKIYIPNVGSDPEQAGMSLCDSVRAIARHAAGACATPLPLDKVINLMLLDARTAHLREPEEIRRVRDMGVDVIEVPLTREDDHGLHDPQLVSEALLSIA